MEGRHGAPGIAHVVSFFVAELDLPVLEFARARVAGLAQEEEQRVRERQERSVRLHAEVRVEGNAVDLEVFDGLADIAGVSSADITALEVEDDRDVFFPTTQVLDQHLQLDDACVAPAFEESEIGFVGEGAAARCLDAAHAVLPDVGHGLLGSTCLELLRHASCVRVEPDADEPVVCPPCLEARERPISLLQISLRSGRFSCPQAIM